MAIRLLRRGGAAAFAVLLAARPAFAAPEIEFASVEAARAVLGARDAFVERLSPFDRAGRLRSGRAVSEAEYLEHVRRAVRDWTDSERARVAAAYAAIQPALTALLPDAEPILLIKTSGEEEGGAVGYTRASAVVLTSVEREERALQHTLAHEVFHVVSRRNPELRRALYEAIGFHGCGEIALPAALAERKITNPDAPLNDHCIRIRADGADAWAVPVLLSRAASFDPDAGVPFFGYLTLSMLLVDRSAGDGAGRPLLRDGQPVLLPIERVEGFFEQVGRNTSYVIHPEEILAENFALLVLGATPVPSPDVLDRTRRVLIEAVGVGGAARSR